MPALWATRWRETFTSCLHRWAKRQQRGLPVTSGCTGLSVFLCVAFATHTNCAVMCACLTDACVLSVCCCRRAATCLSACLLVHLQGFRTPEEVATFGSLMQGLVDIVVGKYDGSLKVGVGGCAGSGLWQLYRVWDDSKGRHLAAVRPLNHPYTQRPALQHKLFSHMV